MNIDILASEGFHFINFNGGQLAATVDLEEIKELADTPHNRERLRLLSQYLVGNVSGTFNEIKRLDIGDQKRTLQIWAKVLKQDSDLRGLVIDIAHQLITE